VFKKQPFACCLADAGYYLVKHCPILIILADIFLKHVCLKRCLQFPSHITSIYTLYEKSKYAFSRHSTIHLVNHTPINTFSLLRSESFQFSYTIFRRSTVNVRNVREDKLAVARSMLCWKQFQTSINRCLNSSRLLTRACNTRCCNWRPKCYGCPGSSRGCSAAIFTIFISPGSPETKVRWGGIESIILSQHPLGTRLAKIIKIGHWPRNNLAPSRGEYCFLKHNVGLYSDI